MKKYYNEDEQKNISAANDHLKLYHAVNGVKYHHKKVTK